MRPFARMPWERFVPVTLLWRTGWLRFLAAALVLLQPLSASEVICISPSGHEAVEDLAAACCEPRSGLPGVGFSEPDSPCAGCSDYSPTATIELKHAGPGALRATLHVESGMAVTVPARHMPISAMNPASGAGWPLDSAAPVSTAVSLRC